MAANFKLQTTEPRSRRSPLTSLSWKSSHAASYSSKENRPPMVRRNILSRQYSKVINTENKMPKSFSSRVKSWKAGASRTFENMRVTFDSLSQRLKRSTRRRYRLSSNSPYMPTPPRTEKTPVKLYSPFGIDTPKTRPRVSKTGTYTPKRTELNTPTCKKDLETLTRANQQLQDVADKIVRTSMRRHR